MEDETKKLSVYKAARSIKRSDNTLYNALKSIYEDSIFVGEISQLWPELPLLANLRCGLWYYPKFHSTCYFKSTDGHTNNLSFNTSRLNLHVAHLAGQKGGCIIVDSTRRGKRFPDSMSKTIPIWTCVLNRCISKHLNKLHKEDGEKTREDINVDWDCSLHLPLWVSETEKASIEKRIEEWTKQLDECGADISSLASSLKKPLRPLWISQKTVIWLNEVPDHDSWDFTPIILVSASFSTGGVHQKTTSEFSWNYIAGAGDDEESWARCLSPNVFWNNVDDLMSSGPDLCNQKVAALVEKDQVYRAHRGLHGPQIPIKSRKIEDSSSDFSDVKSDINCLSKEEDFSWIGSTNLVVGKSQLAAASIPDVDCVLNCGQDSISVDIPNARIYVHLPMLISKLDRFSLLRNLPSTVDFAKLNLSQGKKLMVCCGNGEDISVCVCLAIFTSLFDDSGNFDCGKFFNEMKVTKLEMRRRLVYICKFATNARPSRGNLKQVYSFLTAGKS